MVIWEQNSGLREKQNKQKSSNKEKERKCRTWEEDSAVGNSKDFHEVFGHDGA